MDIKALLKSILIISISLIIIYVLASFYYLSFEKGTELFFSQKGISKFTRMVLILVTPSVIFFIYNLNKNIKK